MLFITAAGIVLFPVLVVVVAAAVAQLPMSWSSPTSASTNFRSSPISPALCLCASRSGSSLGVYPRPDIPSDALGRTAWLDKQWLRVDGWIGG